MTLDREGRAELHYAASEGDAARVRALLQAGADAGLEDRNGWTPLHFAARAQSVEIALLLFEQGAEVDPRDMHGNTPLFRAVFASEGRGDMIALLRRRGADPFAINVAGQSPLGLSRLIANYDVARHFADLMSA